MNMHPSETLSPLEKGYTRNASIIVATLMMTTLPTAGLFAYYGYNTSSPQLYIPAVLLVATFFFDILPITLIGRGQKNLAMMLVMFVFLIDVISVLFVMQGLGVIVAVSIIFVMMAIIGLTLSSHYTTSGMAVSFIFGALAVTSDFVLSSDRIRVPGLETYTPYIVVAILIPIIIIFTREFNRFSLQAKVTLGILITGGLAVSTLTYFGFNRASFISNFLIKRYTDGSVAQTERQIVDTVGVKATEADAIFSNAVEDLENMAEFRSGIQTQRNSFSQGTYWNASEHVFQLPDGQYGNSKIELSAIYIPSTRSLNEQMVADLNTSAYLDFLAPGFLEAHPDAVAVYYISKLGYTIYYPNIELAEMVSPDFDPTAQAFYTIATPTNNPDRSPRWTKPYEDPAGTGLIVTLSIPVYTGSSFEGVLGADIQLASLTREVERIKFSDTDIPFLVDENGLVIAMPQSGYQYFDLQPEVVPMNESPKLNILDVKSQDIHAAVQQALASGSTLSKALINDVNTYVVVSTLPTTGYKLMVLAPVEELNKDILATQTEIDNTLSSTLQNVVILLAALFIGSFLASLMVGQIITRPMKRLTGTVEQISSGNLSSRADVETEDETGILARSFNTMADRLTETLQGLETRIAERTQELEVVNESNAHRATLFEAIARISRIISSTQNVDQLLPLTTETISNQLGFYHVGIFLVDVNHEYAVLVAANSEGGKKMLLRSHRLRIGETGIVGYTTQSGQPRVALDVGQDAVFFNNPDLPETHSEVALPLLRGSEIIGALDVQSKIINAFSAEDVNILSVLADQVSIAIQNARSFQQSREALEQAERAAAQLSEQQWSQYLEQKTVPAFHFDGVDAQPVTSDRNKAQSNSIAIPLILRGVQVGTLKLSASDPNRKWNQNEIAMAQATAERTALAIENARLLQEAQKRAAKERAIGQISAKIGNLVNIENIVQTTIQELGGSLPGTDVAIQFMTKQSDGKNGSGDNHV